MSDYFYMTRAEADSPIGAEWPWLVELICCGHDDGVEGCSTWDRADGFRESYCQPTVASGHDRAGIIRVGGAPPTEEKP